MAPHLQLLGREKQPCKEDSRVQQISLLMGDPSVTPEQVGEAGECLWVVNMAMTSTICII